MNIIVTKGPHWEEAEKKAYEYLHKILSQKANQNERKGA